MSSHSYPDPITPQITFQSFSIPETEPENSAPRPLPRVNGTVVFASVIAMLMFLLGVMTALNFTGSGTPAIVAEAPTAPSSDTLEQIVAASLAQDVMRQRTPDLLATGQAAELAGPKAGVLEVAVLKGLMPPRAVGKLTEEERRIKARQAVDIISRNKLRMLREGVLAGLYTVNTVTEDGQRRVILRTINAEMTRKTIANLLQKAAAEGRIAISASLNTAEGKADMDTLLFNLVQTSLAEDGTERGAEAARELSRRAFAASNVKTEVVKGARIYIVEPGDSLAYLSLQFYGRPSDYGRIFEANRSLLKSPDLIQIGQRLIIPG